jgi:hypothetical protein
MPAMPNYRTRYPDFLTAKLPFSTRRTNKDAPQHKQQYPGADLRLPEDKYQEKLMKRFGAWTSHIN